VGSPRQSSTSRARMALMVGVCMPVLRDGFASVPAVAART
jgi:hypothetical protein